MAIDKYHKWLQTYINRAVTGNPCTTQVKASDNVGKNQDKGIRSSGMNGYSEAGAPDDWDMAIGEIYGYRWWKLEVPLYLAGYSRGDRSSLDSCTDGRLIGANSQPWNDGRNEAVCTADNSSYRSWADLILDKPAPRHEPPEHRVSCGCGFWAYFDKNLEVDTVLGGFNAVQAPLGYAGSTAWLPVLGVVKGTGRVIIGTKGFRAQYAEIIGLCVSDRAKQCLSWDIGPEPRYSRMDSYGNAYYNYNYNRSGWTNQVIRTAPEEVRLLRFAGLEALLSKAYPSARIFSSQASMVSYFPPDPNYS